MQSLKLFHNFTKPLTFIAAITAVIVLIFPGLGFSAINPDVEPPENLKEAKEMGKDAPKNFLEGFKTAWQDALSFLGNIIKGVISVLDKYVWSKMEQLGQAIKNFLFGETEKRQPAIKEEFEKEKIEMQEDLKKEAEQSGKSLWERFKGLLTQ